MKNRRNPKMKGLSSQRIILVLLLNFVVIAVVYLFFSWFFSVFSHRELPNGQALGFTFRELWLCLFLSALINGFLDYKLVVKPMWDLEDYVVKYIRKRQETDSNFQELLESDSLETVINKLVQQQELVHEREKLEQKKRQKAELYALQSQINPHFLYNALDSIRGYALLHDMDQISEITEALSRVFRNMISNKQEILSLRQEVDNINSYMKIQQFRFNNKFQYLCEIEESLQNKYMIPRMVLQPIVENSIMHGLERKIEGGWVRISAYTTERRFILTVTDNGAGIDEERLELLNRAMKMNSSDNRVSESFSQHTGIALLNINERIKINFGTQYGIILNSTPNVRTSVEIVLPLILNRR